ncbi:hypothetical protein ACI65C_011611 [Semiaphis heraclei]
MGATDSGDSAMCMMVSASYACLHICTCCDRFHVYSLLTATEMRDECKRDYVQKCNMLVNRPSPRPITPAPLTPVIVDGVEPKIDFSQCGQRIVFSPWSHPARAHPSFGYSEMYRIQMNEWFRPSSPVQPLYLDPASLDMFPSASPGSYALNVIKGMELSPSPPRQSQTDERLQSSSQISPCMLT